ncbi:hypothetical protein ACGFY0_45250 [Streptomyces chartreusis]|uniref:hypothetical protein n=1 Tax=Streptomyces chartreusis TaxID=1969 RepID=UPI00371CD3BB
MTHSPTPTELLALKTANAALLESNDSFCDLVATVVFALGSAQLLQSPETAAEMAALRARVAELETERHSTNEALSDAAEALRVSRDQITELEAARENFLLPWAYGVDAKTLDNFVGDLIRAAESPLMTVVYEIHQTVAEWRRLMESRATKAEPAPQRQAEDPHDGPLHQRFELCRDLPTTTIKISGSAL